MNNYLKMDIADLKQLIKQYPIDYEHPSDLGWLYYNNQQFAKAFEWLSKSMLINSASPITLNRIGCVNVKRKKYRAAVENFNRCIELEPLNGYAYNNRSIAYHKLHEFDRAMDDRFRTIQILFQGETSMLNIMPEIIRRKRTDNEAISSLMTEAI